MERPISKQLSPFSRTVERAFKYEDDYVQPDQSLTIGQIIERHIDAQEISNHMSEAVEDVNIESPMAYDTDLTDIPTKYQDKDYFDYLNGLRRSISDGATDTNPKNLSPNEKVPTSTSESVPSDITPREGA